MLYQQIKTITINRPVQVVKLCKKNMETIKVKDNLLELINNWYNDRKEYVDENFPSVYEWLYQYVKNCDQEFVLDFFDAETAEEHKTEELRTFALNWLTDNINF